MWIEYKKNSIPRQFAFTLAEVLVTLGIIGIIAAMVIPPLVNASEKIALRSQFKKSYSILSDALAATKVDLGVGAETWSYYTYWNGSSRPYANEFINNYYSHLKVVGTQTYNKLPVNFNNSANAYFSFIGNEKPIKLLPDGSTVDCQINAGEINISVDINGPSKLPNRAGYDIFVFFVDRKGNLQPYGQITVVSYVICNGTSTEKWNGLGCAYYALTDKNPSDSSKGYWDTLE